MLTRQNLLLLIFGHLGADLAEKLGPVLDEIAQDFEGKIKIVKLNTDENLKTAKEYSVSGLPTLLIFKEGKPVERLVGLMPKTSIITNIEKHL